MRRWQIRFLYAVGAWNLLGGAAALADPSGHLAQFYVSPPPLAEPVAEFFYRCTWIQVMAWGAGYLFAAGSPAAAAPILLAGALGKAAYCAACVLLYATGAARPALLAAGLLDLAFAAVFVLAVRQQRAAR